jgi:hypothetical protein
MWVRRGPRKSDVDPDYDSIHLPEIASKPYVTPDIASEPYVTPEPASSDPLRTWTP